jgi:hypothetical protein
LEVRAVRQPGGGMLLVARGGVVLPLDPDRDVLATAGAAVRPGASFASGTLPGISLNGIDVTGQIGGGRLGEFVALRDSTLPRHQRRPTCSRPPCRGGCTCRASASSPTPAAPCRPTPPAPTPAARRSASPDASA